MNNLVRELNNYKKQIGLSCVQIAQVTGSGHTEIRNIFQGDKKLTAVYAIRLGALFGVSPKTLMLLQIEADLDRMQEKLIDDIDVIKATAEKLAGSK